MRLLAPTETARMPVLSTQATRWLQDRSPLLHLSCRAPVGLVGTPVQGAEPGESTGLVLDICWVQEDLAWLC